MLKCAIVGATGYTGIELAKILLQHPKVEVTGLTTRQKEAIPLQELIPSLAHGNKHEVVTYNFEQVESSADLIFLCLPHTEAAETVVQFRKAGKVVIDLSADFRLKDLDTYDKWYGVSAKHAEGRKQLQQESVYGLPEFYREEIKKADLVANPGCYPTSALLAIAPLLKQDLIQRESIIIDSKSGFSGGGKKFAASPQFEEAAENFSAYKVGRHQHTPEIEQGLSDVSGEPIKIAFTTHLLPLYRGILSTVYLRRKPEVNDKEVLRALTEYYVNEPFVRVKSEGEFPTLKDVQDTNYCDLGCWSDDASDQVVIISVLDNLIKGASGQAVQNMNIRFGFTETEGLR